MRIQDGDKVSWDKLWLGICTFIEGRKVAVDGSFLTKDAAMGFNLACDFLAHELRKIRELGKPVRKEGGGVEWEIPLNERMAVAPATGAEEGK